MPTVDEKVLKFGNIFYERFEDGLIKMGFHCPSDQVLLMFTEKKRYFSV